MYVQWNPFCWSRESAFQGDLHANSWGMSKSKSARGTLRGLSNHDKSFIAWMPFSLWDSVLSSSRMSFDSTTQGFVSQAFAREVLEIWGLHCGRLLPHPQSLASRVLLQPALAVQGPQVCPRSAPDAPIASSCASCNQVLLYSDLSAPRLYIFANPLGVAYLGLPQVNTWAHPWSRKYLIFSWDNSEWMKDRSMIILLKHLWFAKILPVFAALSMYIPVTWCIEVCRT